MTTLKLLVYPAFIANSATNIFNASSALIYTVVRHIHVTNVTGSAVTFSLYLGATGASVAGTQLFSGLSVPANAPFDYYCAKKLLSTDFLVGIASSASALVITIEGEQYVV